MKIEADKGHYVSIPLDTPHCTATSDEPGFDFGIDWKSVERYRA